MKLTKDSILHLLRQRDERQLDSLWLEADETRRRNVGDGIYLRGIIEYSNICCRMCHYCGLRCDNDGVSRYTLGADELVQAAHAIHHAGVGTVVLQSGEAALMDLGAMVSCVRAIKSQTPLAVTLSFGELTEHELAVLRNAGADRYLLKFETSNAELLHCVHPPRFDDRPGRIDILRTIRRLGYETGSGFMVGLPGQTYDDLANDILLLHELDLDMIGIGPYLPHPATPMGKAPAAYSAPAGEQVPNDELTTYIALALARLACPQANIPATTAMVTLKGRDAYTYALARGANVIMPNMTPHIYRSRYEIYPDRYGLDTGPVAAVADIRNLVESAGRYIAAGRGDSLNRLLRIGMHTRGGKEQHNGCITCTG